MSTDIGPKVGIDGAKDFKQALAEINASLRTVKTEMDAVTSAFDKNDQSTEKLTEENNALIKSLTKLYEEQKRAAQAVEYATKEWGENSTQAQRAQQVYNKTTTDINNMERQLETNNQALTSMAREAVTASRSSESLGNALSSANASLKLHQAELKAVESEYQGNQNSMEALTAKGEALSRVYDAQERVISALKDTLSEAEQTQAKYADEVTEYSQKIDSLQQNLTDLQTSTGDTSREEAKLTDEINRNKEALEVAKSTQAGAAQEVVKYKTELSNASTASNDLSRSITETNGYIDEAANSADGCAASIDEFGNKTQGSASSINALASALAAAGVAKAVKEIAEALKEAVDASIEFESAITGVYKTVEGTPEQLQAIADGIKQMSTEIPATTTELAGVAEAAGQLGIATSDILAFTEVMTMLGTTTNMSADEAATALARFANITGMSAEQYSNLGSTIVALGNNFATTESEITNMATNLASAGTLAGLTESEILALSAAMSSVGIEAQAGGTAMTQTLTAMEKAVASGGDSLDEFARVAGMSSAEFSAAWKNEPIVAIQAFISGLGNLEAQGESATLWLEEMGMSGVRQSNMLKSLALASEELAGAIGISSSAWSENTALLTEAELRYGTTESKIQLFKNSVDLLKVAVGDALTPALGEMADAGADAFQWAAEFVEEHPEVVGAITGIVVALGALAVGLTTYAAVATAASAVANALGVSLTALKATLVTTVGPIAAVVAVAGALAGMLLTLAESAEPPNAASKELAASLDEAREAYINLKDEIEQGSASIESLVAALDNLMSAEERSAADKEVLLSIINQLNEAIPGLNLAYNAETDALNMTTDAINAKIAAEEAEKAHQADIAYATELRAKQQEVTTELTAAEEAHTAAVEAYNNRLKELDPAMVGYDNQLNQLSQRVNETGSEVERLTDLEGEYASELESVNSALDSYNSALEENANASDTAAEAAQKIVSALQELEAEYTAAYEAAYDSMSKQFDLWEEAPDIVAKSVDAMNAGLVSQEEYWTSYADNVNNLMGRNIDGIDQLVAKYSDGSAESAAALAGLASASDAELEAVITQMEATETALQAAADASAKAQVDFDQRADEIIQRAATLPGELDLNAEMGQSGVNTIQGYINGIDSKSGALYAKMEGVARLAMARFRYALGEASPSREYKKSGVNSIDGYILGVESKSGDMQATMAEIAQAGIEAFDSTLSGSVAQLQKYSDELAAEWEATFKEIVAGTEASLEELNSIITDSYSAMMAAPTESMLAMQAHVEAEITALAATANDFDSARKLLDRALKFDIVDEETYYESLRKLSDTYLQAAESAEDRWKVEEELYKYELEKLDDLQKEQEKALKEQEKLNEEKIKELETLYKEEQKLQEEALKKAAQEYEDYLQEISDATQAKLQKIQDAYDEVVKKQETMQGKLSDYGGLYDEFTRYWSTGEEETIKTLANLDKQMNGMRKYAAMLEDLESRGISSNLMGDIVGMDMDSAMEYGEMLMKLTDEQFAEYSSKWDEKLRLAEEISSQYYQDEISALEEEYNRQLEEGLSQLKDIAFDAGEETVNGLIAGMKAQEDALRAQAAALAKIMESSMKSGLQINSPSKVMEQIGGYAGEGLIIGFEEQAAKLKDTMLASIPSSFSLPQQQQDDGLISAFTSALNTLSASIPRGQSGDANIVMSLDGMEMARVLVPRFREVDLQSPAITPDY